MKILSTIKRSLRKGIVLGALTAVLATAGFAAATSSTAQAAAGFDCDTNAVEYCGAAANASSTTASPNNIITKYKSGDGKNTAAHIQPIYTYFGISATEINSLPTTAKLGTVTKSGDVILNGKVVANNAITTGRHDIAGSTKVVSGGTTFYVRKPSVSFLSNTLSAYVVVDKDGVFQYAILTSCANPVKATPTTKPPVKTPAYTINKEVRAVGTVAFQKSITLAKPGTAVEYRITIRSTGTAPVTNLKAYDTLPAHISYTGGTLALNGNGVSIAQGVAFFNKADGYRFDSVAPGTTEVFTFKAVVGAADTTATCVTETLNNVGQMTATSLPAGSSNATVTKNCLPKPVYACTKLTPVKVSRTDVDYTATATASNGATIVSYTFNFGDGTNKVVTTAANSTTTPHAYTAPGTYNANVSVQVNVNGAVQTVTAPACNASFTVTAAPAAECTNATLNQGANPRDVTATATYTAANGATLTTSSFNWGDGTTNAGTNGANNTITNNHMYATDGTKTVIVTLTFTTTEGATLTSTCQATIPVTAATPTCDKLDVTVNNDDKTVTVKDLKTTANGAELILTGIDWGDGSEAVVATDITGMTHTYKTDGPFTISAAAAFNANGEIVTKEGPQCNATVTFTEAPTPPVTPPTPPIVPVAQVTVLPNTGAGSVVAIFGSLSAAAAVAYSYVQRRRLSL
jgi:hypothetical protein